MRPNFLNQNAGRSFPFIEDFQELLEQSEASLSASRIWGMQNLTNDIVLDFGCTFGVDIGYDASTHIVYLHTIRRTATSFVFDFRTTISGFDAGEHVLRFETGLSDPPYTTVYANMSEAAAESEESVSQCGSSVVNDWAGYLTVGRVEALTELLPQEGDVIRGDETGAIVEPGLIRSLRGSYLRRVYTANGERTRTTNPSDCLEQTWPFTRRSVYPSDACITGRLRFVEGYNLTIEQLAGQLTFNATVGGGAGEPPAEVEVFDGEQPANGRNLLTGGPKCNEVIRSINGVGGRVVEVLAGAGCNIEADPDNHRLIVDFNMNNMALCYDGEYIEEESVCEDPTPRSPYCGDAT
jgi:hypothetical protein